MDLLYPQNPNGGSCPKKHWKNISFWAKTHQNVGIRKDVHPASNRAGHHWLMLVIRLDPWWIFLNGILRHEMSAT